MGIDALDISFRLEKALDIRIEPADWTGLFADPQSLTVRGLTEMVLRKLGGRVVSGPTSGLVERIREAIARVTGRAAADIPPDAVLVECLPRQTLVRDWATICRLLNVRLPPLRGLAPHLLLPLGCETVDRLAEVVGLAGPAFNVPEALACPLDAGEVAAVVRAVLVESLGVQPSQLTPHAHLIRDLGMS